MRLFLYTSAFLLAFSSFAYGQSIDDLKREKEKLLSIIENNNKLIEEYASRKSSEMLQISVVDDKILKRQSLINVYKTETEAYNRQIKAINLQLDSIQDQISAIKKDYAEMLRQLQLNNLKENGVLYILSARSFNESYRRYLYMKQYEEYRKMQYEALKQSTNKFNELKSKVSDKLSSLNILLSQAKLEANILKKELNARKDNVDQILKSQSDLQMQIVKAQAQTQALDQRIRDIIAEEAAKAKAELAKAKSEKKTSEIEKLSDDINKNIGKLPWPVKSFVITSYYGEHDHPLVPSIKIRNNGLDMDILASKEVHPVHKGVVSRVIMIPGNNTSIIVRHGDVMTVYSNFSQVFVKKDQEVNESTNLGTVYTGDGLNSNILHFELWKGEEKQNPEKWLKKH